LETLPRQRETLQPAYPSRWAPAIQKCGLDVPGFSIKAREVDPAGFGICLLEGVAKKGRARGHTVFDDVFADGEDGGNSFVVGSGGAGVHHRFPEPFVQEDCDTFLARVMEGLRQGIVEKISGVVGDEVTIGIRKHVLRLIRFDPDCKFVEPLQPVREAGFVRRKAFVRNFHGIASGFPERADYGPNSIISHHSQDPESAHSLLRLGQLTSTKLYVIQVPPFILLDPAFRLQGQDREGVQHVVVADLAGFLVMAVKEIQACVSGIRTFALRCIVEPLGEDAASVGVAL
jgi:hypothetical protein